MPIIKRLATATLLLSAASPLASQDLPNGAPPSWPIAEDLPLESRQFDFWVGEWDVNLRVKQEDGSWADTHRAVAHIFPILEGKAVLELWDAPTIKGFSLRYFDVSKDEWVLWLNWPGPNRSGSSSLSGTFRHGRGDFFATRTSADGSEILSRYSFNDITPHSLRWDDGYSEDGGRTWRGQWIMEWTRTAAVPALDTAGGPAHTFSDGSRCDQPQFDWYVRLSGRRSAENAPASEGERKSGNRITLTGHEILDGCALALFFDTGSQTGLDRRFGHLTWNTYVNRYELLLLDPRPESPAYMLYSEAMADGRVLELDATLVLTNGAPEDGTVRVSIKLSGEDVRWLEERRSADAEDSPWQRVLVADFGSIPRR